MSVCSRAHLLLCLMAASCATSGRAPISTARGAVAAPSPAAPYAFGTASPLILGKGTVVGSVRAAPWPRSVALGTVASGLPPGSYRVYLHAVGRCDLPDFGSAGPAQVGKQDRLAPADIGPIEVGTDGRVHVTKLAEGMKLRPSDPGDLPILLDADGVSLIMQAGNARVACAVLR